MAKASTTLLCVPRSFLRLLAVCVRVVLKKRLEEGAVVLLDTLMSFSEGALGGMMDALPVLNVNLDTGAILQAMATVQAWNNWLPFTELVAAVTVAFAFWGSMQLLKTGLKAFEVIKP